MRRIDTIALAVLIGFGAAGSAWADPHEGGGGGTAAEKRSDQADENSNAQWDEDSTRGADRSAERKREPAKGDEHERHEKKAGHGKSSSKGKP